MKIRLDIFEGPLDLLIYLIKKHHLDIYDIPIAKVVEQYLQFIELMKLLDIDLASEYLVMAANLINIKSRMLLPQAEKEEEAEVDPREDLVQKLLEYEKFKGVASFLKDKEGDRRKYFSRPAGSQLRQEESFLEASIFDLISAFKTALGVVPKDVFFQVIKDEFTVEEKVGDILQLLAKKDRISLDALISRGRTKIEVVVTFLAVLELIKSREIVAVQEKLFGPILVIRRDRLYSAV